MEKLTMPQINVLIRARANDLIRRSGKGVVALLIRDAIANDGPKTWSLGHTAQIPKTLGLSNQRAIRRTFLGGVNPPRKVLIYCMGTSATVTADCPALAWLGTQQWDYLAGHAELSPTEAGVLKEWILAQRAEAHSIGKVVLPNLAGGNEAIINFTAEGIKAADGDYDAAAYCGRIAGLLAGTPMAQSATYAVLPEVQDITRLTPAEEDAAVGKGQLILHYDGEKVRLGRAVNSLVDVAEPRSGLWRKIKIVELLDMVDRDIRTVAQDGYIGRVPNSYDSKIQLITAVREYLARLASGSLIGPEFSCDIDLEAQNVWLAANGVDTAGMSAREIREANTDTHVFLVIRFAPVDAMEDISVAVEV